MSSSQREQRTLQPLCLLKQRHTARRTGLVSRGTRAAAQAKSSRDEGYEAEEEQREEDDDGD
jgi:hypothetical protein